MYSRPNDIIPNQLLRRSRPTAGLAEAFINTWYQVALTSFAKMMDAYDIYRVKPIAQNGACGVCWLAYSLPVTYYLACVYQCVYRAASTEHLSEPLNATDGLCPYVRCCDDDDDDDNGDVGNDDTKSARFS